MPFRWSALLHAPRLDSGPSQLEDPSLLTDDYDVAVVLPLLQCFG